MSFVLFRRPYRFFLIAAMLALVLCLLPIRAQDAPGAEEKTAQDTMQKEAQAQGVPAGADLSERTQADCVLHETLHYTPCGHSVQRREALSAKLTGLTRTALEAQIGETMPGAAVTGFSAEEVDVSRSLSVPCPLHWVLKGGEDGMLQIWQNRTGEALSLIRRTDIPLARATKSEQQELLDGRVFDDAQALEGYLESLSS